jgi:hypothetical protein
MQSQTTSLDSTNPTYGCAWQFMLTGSFFDRYTVKVSAQQAQQTNLSSNYHTSQTTQ